jgi:hypothetical protein
MMSRQPGIAAPLTVECDRLARNGRLDAAESRWDFMNRDWVLFNLREAQEELRRMIAEIEETPDYDLGEFVVAMGHAYHHLNIAWNSRDEPQRTVEACSEADFQRWRQFPANLDVRR